MQNTSRIKSSQWEFLWGRIIFCVSALHPEQICGSCRCRCDIFSLKWEALAIGMLLWVFVLSLLCLHIIYLQWKSTRTQVEALDSQLEWPSQLTQCWAVNVLELLLIGDQSCTVVPTWCKTWFHNPTLPAWIWYKAVPCILGAVCWKSETSSCASWGWLQHTPCHTQLPLSLSICSCPGL